MTPLNLIKTRSTRYMAHDGHERAVLFHEDYEQLIANADLFEAFQRLIDYECNSLKMWVDECTKEGHQGGETQHVYLFAYNQLVTIRQRMISPEWVLQFLNRDKFDMPEATERIFK